MLTEAALPVDGKRASPPGLWLSISALAADRGVSKQVISKNLKRWNDAGVAVSTRKEGKSLLVNVAEYDRARGDAGDLGRQQGEATKKGQTVADPVFGREQARKAGYDADLAMFKRDEQLARLVPVDDLEQAAIACGEAVVRIADQIVNRAEDVAAAVAKNGVLGARAVLKDVARDLRQRMADEFTKLPAAAMSDRPAMTEEN